MTGVALRSSGALARLVGGVVASLVLTVSAVVLAPAAEAADPVFSQQPTIAWTPTSGIVYAVTITGNTVVVGGSFTQLRNAATGQVVTRNRLAAFDKHTGALLPTFANGANGTVRALETDGTRVYAGGAFTSIGGLNRNRVAALDAGTGQAIAGFTGSASSTVFALELHQGVLYLGGWFALVNGVSHLKVAAVSAVNGSLVTTFNASANETVLGLEVIPGTSTLAVGGAFTQLGTANRRFLGSVSLTTGATTAWAPPANCDTCAILDVAARGDLVYGAVAGPGGRASAWSTTTGVRRWSHFGDGDVQVVTVVGDTVYAGGHYDPQFGSIAGVAATRHEISAIDAASGVLLPWAPAITGPDGVWAIAGDTDSLWVGGGYTRVNGDTRTARLTRFPVAQSAPASQVLVAGDATWRYNDTGANLGTGWRELAYDDSAWRSGPAELGFGDGDEATVMQSGHLTYYARQSFTVADPAQLRDLVLDVRRDDGVVIYLNGVEVVRDNMPGGTITSTTPASVAIAGADESTFRRFTLSTGSLRAGTNVLAVEVHQSSIGSSDVSLAAVLTATPN